MWFDYMYIRLRWTKYCVTFEADWSAVLLSLAVLTGGAAIFYIARYHDFQRGFIFSVAMVALGLTAIHKHCLQLRFRKKNRQ